MSKNLPNELTSYDFLKLFAVVVMIVDHLGWYFFQGDPEFRLIGRLCVPVWFFLIGYAKSRNLDKTLWIGAIVLQFSNFPAGAHILPLNVLATMIAIRLIIDPLMDRMMRSPQVFWSFSVIFLLLSIPSGMVTEYGTLGLILAMFGWLVRHRDDLKEPDMILPQFFAFAVGSFAVTQFASFGFSQAQFFVLALGTLLVCGVLYFFKPVTYPKLDAALPWFVKAPIKFIGRRTMEIYVVHLLIFKALAVYLEAERFQPFHITLFPVS
jgi:hypothetical protein